VGEESRLDPGREGPSVVGKLIIGRKSPHPLWGKVETLSGSWGVGSLRFFGVGKRGLCKKKFRRRLVRGGLSVSFWSV